jgi:hypothetical protein
MNDREIQEMLERTLARHLDWIRGAEAKVAPVLAIDTAMLGVLGALAPGVSGWTVASAAVVILAALLLLVSLLLLFLAAIPRTQGPRDSLVFFNAIKERKAEDYLCAVRARKQEDYIADLAGQCHRNAEICSLKFQLLWASTCLLFLAVIPWLVGVGMLYLHQASACG